MEMFGVMWYNSFIKYDFRGDGMKKKMLLIGLIVIAGVIGVLICCAYSLPDGKTIESIPLENCVGNCYVAYQQGDISAVDANAIMEKRKNADADRRILLAGDCVVTEEAAKVAELSKRLYIGWI